MANIMIEMVTNSEDTQRCDKREKEKLQGAAHDTCDHTATTTAVSVDPVVMVDDVATKDTLTGQPCVAFTRLKDLDNNESLVAVTTQVTDVSATTSSSSSFASTAEQEWLIAYEGDQCPFTSAPTYKFQRAPVVPGTELPVLWARSYHTKYHRAIFTFDLEEPYFSLVELDSSSEMHNPWRLTRRSGWKRVITLSTLDIAHAVDGNCAVEHGNVLDRLHLRARRSTRSILLGMGPLQEGANNPIVNEHVHGASAVGKKRSRLDDVEDREVVLQPKLGRYVHHMRVKNKTLLLQVEEEWRATQKLLEQVTKCL